MIKQFRACQCTRMKERLRKKEAITLDESVYDNEIKIEDKKSFMKPDIPNQKKKSFHRRRKEERKNKAFSKQFTSLYLKMRRRKRRRKRRKDRITFLTALNLDLPTS